MKTVKVPTPRQLPSGNWFLQVCVKGRRISVTEPTEELCIAKAMAMKQDLLEAENRQAKPTLSVAIDRYIEARENVLSPSSIVGYRVIQRNRFKQAMNRPITAYDEDGWRRLVNAEAKIISAKTLQNSWFLISAVIYEQTGKRYNISLPQIVSDERPFLEPDQIQTFIKAIHGSKYEIVALLALSSLRRSELLALTWDKVNLKEGTIKIWGAVVSDGEKMVYKKENKNRSSRRVVPIMIPQLAEALRTAQQGSGYVVTMSPSAALRGINKMCRENDLPEVGIHGLRHSFASLAYHLGMPEKIAMQIGGWENDATMKRIYTHVAKADITKYQNIMSEFYNKITNDFTNGIPQTV